MALSDAQLKKYGLSRSDATASNHDKGIVQGPSGKFYTINNFEHQQRDGRDTDQGDVFSSSLEQDTSKKFKNFNTATDVEGALMALTGKTKEKTKQKREKTPVQYSPRLGEARARLAQRTEDIYTGDRYTSPANTFLNRYKLKLGEKLATGYYAKPHQNVTNSSKVASGANGVSVDAAYYAKTGQDNRLDDPQYAGSMAAYLTV